MGLLLTLLACGGGLLGVFQSARSLEQVLLRGDAGLARVLAGLKGPGGAVDFNAIRLFVEASDRPGVQQGLVYAIETSARGRLKRGALNPRLFASLGPEYGALVVQGRRRVLEKLAAGKVERARRIRELSVGRLRFGFELLRIDRQVDKVLGSGGVAVAAAFVLGVALSLLWGWRLGASLRRGAEGADVRTRLEPFLGGAVADRLLGTPAPLELQAEERAVGVLVVAFRGLCALGSRRGSAETLRLANAYLAPVIDAVGACQGVVTQLDAHRVVAVWGFPEAAKEPERDAVKAARNVLAATSEEARRQGAAGGTPLLPCIGVASGRAVGGNLGSARRAAYTVTGFAVDLALQTELRARPGEILLAEAAFDKVRGAVGATPCTPLEVNGLADPVPLYRVDGDASSGRP